MKKKKILLLKLIPIFITIIIGYGCNNDNDMNENIILPITPDKDVIDFFEKTLPKTNDSECFFHKSEEDTFCVINNTKEFQEAYSCSAALPIIDFDKYTLIIGKKTVPNSFYSATNQRIIESDLLRMIIKLEIGENHWPAFSRLYHWGIYPKLPISKKLNVEYLF